MSYPRRFVIVSLPLALSPVLLGSGLQVRGDQGTIHVFDDFQDGDYTTEPPWDGGTSNYSVVPDPTDPANLVLQGTGGPGQHIPLEPVLDEEVPWSDFYFAVDVMSSVPTDFNPLLSTRTEDGAVGYTWHQFHNEACIGDGPGGESGICCPGETSCLNMPTAAQSELLRWYRIEWWHDESVEGGPIRVRFTDLQENLVLHDGVYSYSAPLATTGIGHARLETERETSYYYDNFVLATSGVDCNGNDTPDMVEVLRGEALDCNANGLPDPCDIADGTSNDSNENGIPDECDPCEGDVNGDGSVDPLDSGFVLARFGCEYPDDGINCLAADANGDGNVDPLDSGFVLARFGDCP